MDDEEEITVLSESFTFLSSPSAVGTKFIFRGAGLPIAFLLIQYTIIKGAHYSLTTIFFWGGGGLQLPAPGTDGPVSREKENRRCLRK